MNRNVLLIFTRNPELGKCKTRLAEKVGDVNALKIYEILLKHTVDITKEISVDKKVYYSVKTVDNDIWDNDIYQKHQQKGDDLGIRMLNAFINSFKAGYKKVVIIGCDILDLNKEHINAAFSALQKNDVVVGPAKDGGYYLLGMNKLHTTVFLNKKWGSSSVGRETLSDLSNQKVVLLELLNDIDIYEDIKNYDIFKPYLK